MSRLAGFSALLLAAALVPHLGCRPAAAVAAAPAPAPALLRNTVHGPVEGVDESRISGTYAWKGIPYGRPPVGELRWKAPLEPEAWSGPRAAKAYGAAAAQYGRIYGPGLNNRYDATIGTSLNQAVGSEDCLYLNIWRPADARERLPVIFFLHGGSNVSGYTADPLYDGAALARTGNAVVVTAGFRVGILGWFDLAQLKSPADPLGGSGNFGTLDQLLALEFVQRNIASFGGDPGNVTLMGQSSGASCVASLLTSPLLVKATPRLAHRAILMSGGLALPSELPKGGIATLKPAAAAQAQAKALLQALVIADGLASDAATAGSYLATRSDAQIAAYLRGKTPAELFRQLLGKLAPAGLGGTLHIPDGAVVASDPLEAVRAGNYLKVPLLFGITREETKVFASFLALSPALGGKPGLTVDDATRFSLMAKFDGDAAPALAEKDLIEPSYLPAEQPGTGYNARLALLNRLFFIANGDAMLKAFSSRQSDIWSYRFDWAQQPAPWNVVYGAAHLMDLPFVFGNFGPSAFANTINSSANRPGREALSAAMMAAFGAFARSGDPNHPALGTAWPVWPGTLVFDATLTEKRISTR